MSGGIALLFPGQGSQEIGMGRDLFCDCGRGEAAGRLFSVASDAAGVDIEAICRRGPAKRLADTVVLQPALTAVSLALWQRLQDAGLRPAATAGHSVGELAAAAASGFASADAMVRVAAQRGRLMADAAAATPGAMAALSGADVESVRRAVDAVNPTGVVGIAAVNGPTQVVISGDRESVDLAAAALTRSLSIKVTPLRVSGAWHSALMAGAVSAFRAVLDQVRFAPAAVPMVFNRDGVSLDQPGAVAGMLSEQLVRPVRWDLVMGALVGQGITRFVEVGPGRVLRGLLRLNFPEPALEVYNVSDVRSLERTLALLQG